MGRSVSTPRNAEVVCYQHVSFGYDEETGEFDENAAQWEWEDYLEDYRSLLSEHGFTKADAWLDDEDHVVAKSEHWQAGISEYCDVIALWLVPNPLQHRDFSCCGESWSDTPDSDNESQCHHCGGYVQPDPITDLRTLAAIKGIPAWFRETFGDMQMIGRASNGEAFFA